MRMQMGTKATCIALSCVLLFSVAVLCIDAQMIAWMTNRNQDIAVSDKDFDIYVANADRSNERRLTDNVAMDGYPAWSPDGKTIAFSSDRIHDGWLAEIWLINVDGSNLRQVTDSPGVGDLGPSFSPDGKSVCFETYAPDEFRQIVSVNIDGSNRRELTESEQGIGSVQPDWGPDGRIVFSSAQGGNDDIWVMDADGSNQIKLTASLGTDRDPVWSPDGKSIAFWSNRADGLQTWVMDADGGNERNLSAMIKEAFPDGPGGGWPSDWTPDGRILFNGGGHTWIANADGTSEASELIVDAGELNGVYFDPAFAPPPTSVSPAGKLTTSWGEIKSSR